MSISPKEQKINKISALWILPIIALGLCGWLAWDNYRNGDIKISIYFSNASGLVPGKTHIMARGVKVGTIVDVEPEFDKDKILVTAKVPRTLGPKLSRDTLFWVVRPELSVTQVTGLETIMGGNYVGFQLGTDREVATVFNGLESPPPISLSAPGLHIELRAKALGSIQKGTGIYYRNIQIGSVQEYQLNGENDISLQVYIEDKYQHLVHKGSLFSDVSGLTIQGKFPDIKIHVESAASLIKGGILVHTPTNFLQTETAEDGDVFTLYPDFDAAKHGIEMTLKLPSLYNLQEGATKVIYHGVELGVVKRIDISPEEKLVTATILLDPRAESVLREGSIFWLVKPELSLVGVENLDTLITGSYISFEMGPENAPFKDVFEIAPEEPALQPLRKGQVYYVTSEEISFSKGTPIYFKNINVGEIIKRDLLDSGRMIRTSIYIYEEYVHLLTRESVFWQYSGVQVAADLSTGLDVNIGPLGKVMAGGLAFTSPDKLEKKKSVAPKEGDEFVLYASYKDAVKASPALQKPGKTFEIKLVDNNSLSIGAPIMNANIAIGQVVDFSFGKSQGEVLATAFVEKEYAHLVNSKTRFYDISGVKVSGGLSGIDIQTGSLQSMINGGIGCFTAKDARGQEPSGTFKLYPSLQDALNSKAVIKVSLKDLEGLKKGAAVVYKGIQIGEVEDISLGADLHSLNASLSVEERVLPLFRDTTKIWLETPQISLQKVENLSAVIMGPSLAILPGKGALKTHFMVEAQAPKDLLETGFPVTLRAKTLNSLTVGSPVYYRQVQVGSVVDYRLSDDTDSVEIFLNIKSEYRELINMGSRFWSSTGINIDAGLFSGVSVRTESFESIMIGGISFANPEEKGKRVPAPARTQFCLHDEPEEKWLQ